MIALLEVLAEPSRFQIVESLKAGPHTVSELVDLLGKAQPQVSKHLQLLTDAGVLTKTVKSHFRIYALRPEPFQELGDWVSSFRDTWNQRLDNLETVLESLTNNHPD